MLRIERNFNYILKIFLKSEVLIYDSAFDDRKALSSKALLSCHRQHLMIENTEKYFYAHNDKRSINIAITP